MLRFLKALWVMIRHAVGNAVVEDMEGLRLEKDITHLSLLMRRRNREAFLILPEGVLMPGAAGEEGGGVCRRAARLLAILV